VTRTPDADRWPLSRFLRLVAVATVMAVPAVAVTTVDAGARTRGTSAAAHKATDRVPALADDMNMMRIALNQARLEKLRELAIPATPEARARASRSLVRLALNLPTYVRPVPGPVTQWYGYHPGIDIAPGYGTPIGAAHSGVVTFVGWDDGYGMHVEVAQVDGYVTTYSHMSAFKVKVGQVVLAGQQLGNVGSTGYSTGPHLHFEVHVPGGARMDPAVWLREHGVKI
jgi:murein DD-endopeptidase MepM/ murein hydrolase activator NlpD